MPLQGRVMVPVDPSPGEHWLTRRLICLFPFDLFKAHFRPVVFCFIVKQNTLNFQKWGT